MKTLNPFSNTHVCSNVIDYDYGLLYFVVVVVVVLWMGIKALD